MSLMSWSLAGLLALEATAPPRGGPTNCELTDNRCKAELFVRRAKEAKNDEQRALYFNVAHRSYLALFDKTGDERHLCAARRMYDKSVAIKNQPAGQRASFEALLGDLATRERKAGVRCESAPKRPKTDAPLLATKGQPPAPPPAEAPRQAAGGDDVSSEVLARAAADPPASLVDTKDPEPSDKARTLEPTRTAAPESEPSAKAGASLLVAGAGLAGAATAARPPLSREEHFDRRRLRIGLATLVPGLMLFIPMAGLLAYRAAGERELAVLNLNTTGRPTIDAEDATAAALGQRFTNTTAGAIVLGLTGGALVVTGTVFLATGARHRRVAVAPWGARGLGGLVLEGRF